MTTTSAFPSEKVGKLKHKGTSGQRNPICLCTGKTTFAMKKIIDKMELGNYHMLPMEVFVVFDPINNKILKSAFLDKSQSTKAGPGVRKV